MRACGVGTIIEDNLLPRLEMIQFLSITSMLSIEKEK